MCYYAVIMLRHCGVLGTVWYPLCSLPPRCNSAHCGEMGKMLGFAEIAPRFEFAFLSSYSSDS